MSLGVHRTGLFNSADSDTSANSLYEFIGHNRPGSPRYENAPAKRGGAKEDAKMEEQRAHTDAHGHRTIDWHEICDSQSTRHQTRTVSDHALSQSPADDNIVADLDWTAAGECLAEEPSSRKSFTDQFTLAKNWSDYTLRSNPEQLCSLAVKFTSLYPEPSTDSVFEDYCGEPEDARQAVDGGFAPNHIPDQRVVPSTTSTDFSLTSSVNDTASQPELCDLNLSGKELQGDGRVVTLADYLDSLNGSNGSNGLLKSIPQLAQIRRVTAAAPVSDPMPLPPTVPPLYRNKQQQQQQHDPAMTTVGTEVTPGSCFKPMSNGHTAPHPDGSTPGANLPKSGVDPMDYMLKRRAFLLERLVERYEELLKLMNEELELTGHPPKHYLENLNAYKSSQAALRKLLASRVYAGERKDPGTEVTSTKNVKPHGSEITAQPTSPRSPRSQLPNSSNELRTSRLQETGFLLSPKVVRKVSMNLSPSANHLLMNSQLSLCAYDTQSVGEPESVDKRPPPDQCPAYPGVRNRSQSGSRRFNPLDSWSKRKQAISNRITQNKLRASESGLAHTAPLSLSLSDLGRESSRIAHADTGTTVPATGDRSPADAGVESDSSDCNRSRRRASIASMTCSHELEFDNPDRAQAVAWIDMELDAVRKILEANRLCAAESNRKKAYQLACQKNEETIAQLERQKALLLHGKPHPDSDNTSVGACSSNTGDSIKSAPDTTDEPHRTSDRNAPDSVGGSESARATGHDRLKISPSVPVGRSSPNMIDGLRKLIPVVKSIGGGLRAKSPRPTSPRPGPNGIDGSASSEHGNHDQTIHSDQPTADVLGPTEDANTNSVKSHDSNSAERNGPIRIVSQIVPVCHQRVVTLESLDDLARVRPQATGPMATGPCGDSPRLELSCDTGLGASLVHSVHTESGSDLSRWSAVSMETRSTSSAEQTMDLPGSSDHASHAIHPSLTLTSAPVLSGPGTVPRANRVVRVCYERREPPSSDPDQNRLSSDQENVNKQRVSGDASRQSQGKVYGHGIVYSRLPAYRMEPPNATRTASPLNGICNGPYKVSVDRAHHLPRGITTVFGDTVFRHPVQSNTSITETSRRSVTAGSTERLVAIDRASDHHSQSIGTQTTRAAYTVLPKLPGSVSSAWSSNRPGCRTPDPIPSASRRHHQQQHQNNNNNNNSGVCQYGSPVLSIRLQTHAPGRESTLSPLCVNSTSTPVDRQRSMVHSQSGELAYPRRPASQMSKLTKSSSSALVTSPHCLRRSAPEQGTGARRRSKSIDPPALPWFRTGYPWDRVRSP